MARREERAYREYVRDEQRSQPGCPARELCDESLLRDTRSALPLLVRHGPECRRRRPMPRGRLVGRGDLDDGTFVAWPGPERDADRQRQLGRRSPIVIGRRGIVVPRGVQHVLVLVDDSVEPGGYRDLGGAHLRARRRWTDRLIFDC